MPSIHTLIPDIYRQVDLRNGWFTDELAQDLGSNVARRLKAHYNDEGRKGALRLSKLGPWCPKALWHSVHTPELAEPLPAHAKLKYSYGHILEAQAILLAKAAGHSVTGEQDELTLDGVVGHRDCVIDGCVVDVKSTVPHYLSLFKSGEIKEADTFGYLEQLDGYLGASQLDDLVTEKHRAYILAIDKMLGHMVLYEHTGRLEHIRNRIEACKQIVARERPPACKCGTEPSGKSGNIQLDIKASYSSFKYCCHPTPRTFLYADGPVYLTRVVKRPKDHIVEVDKFGKIVYNM